MTVIDKVSIIKSIKDRTIEVKSLDDFWGIYQFIKLSLNQAREMLEALLIDLIIVENIYADYENVKHHGTVLQKKEREVIHIYTIGDFAQDSEITWQLSEILSAFLVEYLIIPILNNINYDEFEQLKSDNLENIYNSIIVYESKRSVTSQ